MKTIIVDDDEISRETFLFLSKTIRELDIAAAFDNPEQAIRYVGNHVVDLAVLAIKMPVMDGIELGHRLRDLNPCIMLVYTAEAESYAMAALKLRAAAYLLKPLNQEELAYAVDTVNLLARRNEKKIYARTFGYFDLFVDGKPVMFKSAKAKELLALLIDRRGGTVTTEQIINVLWDNRPNDEATQNLCSKVVKTLQKELTDYGIGEILIQKRGVRSIDVKRIHCDMYDLMEGHYDMKNCFLGDYMIEYSWAEDRIGTFWKRASLFGK